ncbi:MAG: hypothetical protein ABI947_10330 [Chloroflexota bacterium]
MSSQEILPGPYPSIVIHRIHGELSYDAMTADDALGLNRGIHFVLLDASDINLALPEDFLSGARHSYFTNPNLRHMALYTQSNMLGTIGKMVAKLTRRQDRLSVHTDFDVAMSHLVNLYNQAQ